MARSSKGFLVANLFCIVLALCHLQCVISKPNGFSLKLIRRDPLATPSYPGKLTTIEKFQRLVEISKSRASDLHLSEIGTRNSNVVPNTIRPPIAPGAWGLLFAVDANLGTPRRKIALVLDTASDLIWTQCTPCKNCFKQKYPLFDPKKSSSYKKLYPNHNLSKYFNCTKDRCKYGIRYVSGQTARGIASIETFTFQSNSRVLKPVRDIVYGCGNDNRGFSSSTGEFLMTGILGINKSPLSFVRQLGNRVMQRFSYCLPEFAFPRKTAFLRFGNDIVRRGRNMQQTPFVPRPNDNMYALNLIDISIGGHRLGFKPGTFAQGCIIDSGSSISFIKNQAYNAISNLLLKHFSRFRLTRISSKYLCYGFTGGFNKFPNMTFHFQGADFEVAETSLFLIGNNSFCLAVSGTPGETVLGAFQQQNVRLIYDLANDKLSFAKEDCSKDGA